MAKTTDLRMKKLDSNLAKSRVTIGDVLAIPTRCGTALAQVTHKHREPPQLGDLIRVLPGFHNQPVNLQEIVDLEEQFQTFVNASSLIKHGFAEVIGSAEIPAAKRAFPVFRMSAGIPEGADNWWLWDGNREWKIGRLTEEQKRMPIASTWTGPYLIDRICEGWNPQWDV